MFATESEKANFIDLDTVRRSSDTLGIVRDKTVDTAARQCTCLFWQENRIPCRHAIAFLMKQQQPTEAFMDDMYRLDEYRAAYSGSLKPGLFAVQPDDTLPPLNARAAEPQPRTRGRPSTRNRGERKR